MDWDGPAGGSRQRGPPRVTFGPVPFVSNPMIEKITIRNFLRLPEFQLNQPGQINLIIGENDTGKTGLLRLLYAAAKSLETVSRGRQLPSDASPFKAAFSKKLDGVFQPRLTTGIGSLVTKGSKDKLSLELTFKMADGTKSNMRAAFTESARTSFSDINEHIEPADEAFNALFIPAKEVLTAFRAIRFTRTPHNLLGFDDTYLDLIDSLDVPTSRGNYLPAFKRVNEALEELFSGEIRQTEKEERFVFFKGKQEFPMALTAEGIKKIGILTTLIRNRQLRKGTVLFLDEPETALHPKAIRALMGMLVNLAQAGVQIFLTSHNYFVAKQLVICARQHAGLRVTGCSLVPDADDGLVRPIFSDLRDGLPANPIIEAALEMFNEEVALDFSDLAQ